MRGKITSTVSAPDLASSLYQFIGGEANSLLPTLRQYVWKFGLAHTPEQAEHIANELLQDLVIEALEHSGRFDNLRTPKAWLLGIAVNLIKRRRQNLGKAQKREPLIRDTYTFDQERYSDGELFDRVLEATRENGLEDNYIASEQAATILGLVSGGNREILRLAILVGMNGKELAAQLGVKEATARSKLHRALQELKTTWFAQEGGQ